MSEPAADTCAVCGKEPTQDITVNVNPGLEKVKEPMTIRMVPVCAEHLAEREKLGAQAFFDKHPDALS